MTFVNGTSSKACCHPLMLHTICANMNRVLIEKFCLRCLMIAFGGLAVLEESIEEDDNLKTVAEVSTVFESCSLLKTVFWDPSLKFLSFDDVKFNDVRKTSLYPLFDRHRIAFFQ
ncbi:hypothetical protein D0Y65_000828 [Glycine soja]|uniref:Uncharacterized protein n=1 Tax=Glycine soja TaxID=3848 RepID=A0A445M0D4_GLYSO|nr:hypothetical protein D0Y65_000828 [Glycine soja]